MTNKKAIGITENATLIHMLCRKKYLLTRKKQLNNNMFTLSRLMDKYDNSTSAKLIRSFSRTYQEVPNEYFFHPSIKGFLEEAYVKNPYPPEEHSYFSKNGIPVRSKSEVLIANQLEDYHIPYRYEAAMTLGKQTKYPDFTIKNPFNGQLILWEHFGALHQPGYEQKMNLYMKYGYIPFETIIYTFEFDIKSTHRLAHLIEHIVLQA